MNGAGAVALYSLMTGVRMWIEAIYGWVYEFDDSWALRWKWKFRDLHDYIDEIEWVISVGGYFSGYNGWFIRTEAVSGTPTDEFGKHLYWESNLKWFPVNANSSGKVKS